MSPPSHASSTSITAGMMTTARPLAQNEEVGTHLFISHEVANCGMATGNKARSVNARTRPAGFGFHLALLHTAFIITSRCSQQAEAKPSINHFAVVPHSDLGQRCIAAYRPHVALNEGSRYQRSLPHRTLRGRDSLWYALSRALICDREAPQLFRRRQAHLPRIGANTVSTS